MLIAALFAVLLWCTRSVWMPVPGETAQDTAEETPSVSPLPENTDIPSEEPVPTEEPLFDTQGL